MATTRDDFLGDEAGAEGCLMIKAMGERRWAMGEQAMGEQG
jgi:hypothetical protein